MDDERRRELMRSIRSAETEPELFVRRMLHRMGYRYQKHGRDLPGTPDIVFSGRRKAIFVHGCFWHQHPPPCPRKPTVPRSNSAYWAPKLARNLERDRENQAALAALGWRFAVVWECELRNPKALAVRLRDFLEEAGASFKKAERRAPDQPSF
jgi:DNA mismatch endonuclease (patch repair protein)